MDGGPIGIFKLFLKMFQAKIGYLPAEEKFKAGTANTAFAQHAKRTYALMEADYPFHIVVNKSE